MLIGLVLDLLCVSSPLLFIILYCLLASYSLIHILPLQYSLYITNLHIWPFRLGSNDVSVWHIGTCIAMCFSFFFRMQLIWWMCWYFSWGAAQSRFWFDWLRTDFRYTLAQCCTVENPWVCFLWVQHCEMLRICTCSAKLAVLKCTLYLKAF